MLEARALRRVRVWSRSEAHCEAFVRWAEAGPEVEVEAAESAQAAVDGADLICTTTATAEPVLRGAWLAPGAHINAVGASTATTRELDSAAVAMASLFVDRRESALSESGDFLIPLQEGAIGEEHIRAELGEVLLGEARGRAQAEEITLFNSLGLAVEDLAAAQVVWREAQRVGAGDGRALPGRAGGLTRLRRGAGIRALATSTSMARRYSSRSMCSCGVWSSAESPGP